MIFHMGIWGSQFIIIITFTVKEHERYRYREF